MTLIIVIGFNIIFMLMGFNLSGIASHSYSNYTNYYNVEQAQFLAESAANVAIGSLYQNSMWLYGDSTIHNHSLEGGTYSIQAKRSYPGGASYVTFNIVSSYSSMYDTTTVVCNIPSYSSFAMYTCNENGSPWTAGDTCNGKFHSDTTLIIGGSSGQSAVFNGSVSVGNGIDSTGAVSAGAHPQFKQGAPINGVKLGWLNNFNAVTTTTGYDSSDFGGASKAKNRDIYIQLYNDGTVDVDTGAPYWGNAKTKNGAGWYHATKLRNRVPITQLGNNGNIAAGAGIGVMGIMDTGATGNIHVRGTLSGKLTIANLGHGNVFIDSNVVYNDTSKDLLGLVAADTMYITYDSANTKGSVKIQGAILAKTFAAQQPDSNYIPTPVVNKAALFLYGSLAQKNRGRAGGGDAITGTGFQKRYTYDWRFAGGSNAAPSYPTLPYFQILSWYDRMAWNTSWWSNW